MYRKLVKEAQKRLAFVQTDISESMVPTGSVAWQWAIHALGSATHDWKHASYCFERALDGQLEHGGIPMRFQGVSSYDSLLLLERPYFAPILWRLFEAAPDVDLGEELLRRFFPKVLQHQMYWYRYRDVQDEGLVSIIHPWEAPLPEMDIWESGEYGYLTEMTALEGVLINAAHRIDGSSTRAQGDLSGDLMDSSFLVQDPYLNALISLSNTFLLQIGQFLHCDVQELMEFHELTVFSANDKLWNAEYGIYCSYDQQEQRQVLSGSLSGWMPLISPIPDQSNAEAMRLSFEANFLHENYYLSASNSLYGNRTDFNALSKGALHLWDNWLLYQGLLRFDFDDLAKQVRADSLKLIGEYGFHLFFHPQRSRVQHLGLDPGSQSAAVVLFLEFYFKKLLRVED